MKDKSYYLVLGFIAGIIYVAACGGGGSTIGDMASAAAETIGNAIDIVFDNSSSGLSATTVQGAIDEVEGRVDDLEESNGSSSDDTSTLILGNWQGDTYHSNHCSEDECHIDDTTLTLNSDGSYTCSGTTMLDSNILMGSSSFCGNPGSWELLIKTIKLTDGDGLIKLLQISSVSETQLELLDFRYGESYELTKTE